MAPRFCGFFLAGLAACAQQPVDRGVNFYSREEEEALGAQLAGEFRRGARVFDDPAARAYVERIGAALSAHLPAGWPPFRFEFVADPGGPLEEPLVFPGGYIFIRAALFHSAVSEAEFAGMLAHSMAHAAARHGTRQATRGQIINYASVPLIFMGWDGIHGGNMAVPRGVIEAWRNFELDADRIAVRATAGAGYDPTALLRYVERLQPETAPANSPLPPRDARLANLNAAIAARPASEFERIRDNLKIPPQPNREPPTLRRPDP